MCVVVSENVPRHFINVASSMSRFGLPLSFVAATLFLATGLRGQGATSAPAAPVAPDDMPAPPSMSSRAPETIKRFDKNGDGRIDDDERGDAHEAMLKERVERQTVRITATGGSGEPLRAQLLERFDRNKDGRLDDEERAEVQKIADESAANPAMVALRAEFMKRFDQNGDGKIAGEESSAVREFLAERISVASSTSPMPSVAALRQNLLKRFDRDADGRIDDTEMNAAAESLRPGLEIAVMRGDRFDTNFDGRLGDEEWALARRQLQQWLNGEGVLSPVESGQVRFEAVAAEVARRRALREGAAEQIRVNGSVILTPDSAAEKARLEAVAEEVARRRAQREAAGALPK